MSYKELAYLNQLPPALGPQLSVDSLSIVFASDAPGIPLSLTNDTNYGTVGANTLRTAAQIGNATGAADFNSGAAGAQTLRVVLATGSVVAATQSGTWNITNISGTVSLPTGASTSALQTTGNTSLASIDTKLPSGLTVSSTRLLVDASGTTQPVSGTVAVSNFPATQPISAVSLPLPTGAATDASLSTINSTLTGTLKTAQQGRNSVDLVLHDYSAVNVTNSAYVQLTGSTSGVINKLQVFDSSGQALILAVGAPGSEVDTFYVFPGGTGDVEIHIPAASRLSIIATTATANTGTLLLNCLS